MIRNFVTGVLVGGVVAGAGLGVASQLAPLGQSGGAREQTLAAASQDVAAVADAPKTSVEETPVNAGVKPAQPEPTGADAAEDALLRPTATEGQPSPASIVPEAPAVTDAGDVAPQAEDPAKAEAAEPSKVADEAAEEQAALAASDAPKPAVDGGSVPADADASAPDATATSEAAAVASPEPDSETAAAAAPTATDEPAPEANSEPAADVVQPAPEDAVPGPAKTTNEIVADTATLVPDNGLAEKQVDGVKTGRLPSIAATNEPTTETSATQPEDVPADTSASLPPIKRFARPFTNPGSKPLFAVLLIDPGTPEVKRDDLAALPFPVTFVIDPMAADAAEAAAIYRAAGQEVVMLATGIPKGATASDLEQSFAKLTETLPEAVALMDTAEATFQDNRGLAKEIVTLMAAQGRGVVTFDRGLNAADQAARREAVPAASVFRSLDDDGEDAPLIRRYLDRAAFKAAQEGQVVVIGTARAETIAALLEWAVEGRSTSVALAPITAVMATK